MTGRVSWLHGNALTLPLADRSVHLIVTSPPYFALRSYRDDGEQFDGQLGSEPTPEQFLVSLWRAMDECYRVLRDDGNCWINLGDKFCADNRGSGVDRKRGAAKYAPTGPAGFPPTRVLPKSRMLLPHRFAEGCQDPDYRRWVESRAGLPPTANAPQWIVRMDVVWSKLNGLPEPTTDRVRASHEFWFHMVKSERYFAALDEVREPYSEKTVWTYPQHYGNGAAGNHGSGASTLRAKQEGSLGKAPGSVWEVATEPLRTPAYLVADNDNPGSDALWLPDDEAAWRWLSNGGRPSSRWPRRSQDGSELRVAPNHFAAYPSSMVKRIVLGWSPSAICTACGEPRRPVVETRYVNDRKNKRPDERRGFDRTNVAHRKPTLSDGPSENIITGYACVCADPSASTRPSRVLDPFSGTGTTPIVAAELGRHGIGVDLSADYLRLALWRRRHDAGLRAKTAGVPKPRPELDGQLSLLGEAS